jgi:hypothetical protein
MKLIILKMKPIKGNTSQERTKEIFSKRNQKNSQREGIKEPSKKVVIQEKTQKEAE